jgi:hypothetical protein
MKPEGEPEGAVAMRAKQLKHCIRSGSEAPISSWVEERAGADCVSEATDSATAYIRFRRQDRLAVGATAQGHGNELTTPIV